MGFQKRHAGDVVINWFNLHQICTKSIYICV